MRRRFGVSRSVQAISQQRFRMGLPSPGNLGQIPHNRRFSGDERENPNGRVKVKRPDGKWVEKKRVIWEETNGRELPEGCVVVFVDGDCSNFDPDNLACVERAHMATINKLGLKYYDADSLQACVTLAKIRAVLKSKKKQVKERM